MDRVALSISKELHFNVSWALEEPLNEDCAIAEGRLGLAHGTLESGLEVALFTDDTHTTSTTTHSGFDND